MLILASYLFYVILVYVPHPIDTKRNKTVLNTGSIFKNINDIDFIEIYNGRNSAQEDVNKTQLLCQKVKEINPQVVTVVGSDAHICWELGRNYEIIDDVELTAQNMKQVLSKAEYVKSVPLQFAHKWTKTVKCLRFFRTLETMKYDIASMQEVEERSSLLAEQIEKDFHPEIVVFVAKGGYLVGNSISEYMNVPLYEVATKRSGSKLKKLIAPIFRIIPSNVRFWLIDLEMNMGVHKKAGDRKIAVPQNLRELSEKRGIEIKKILAVDDSVDTGMTAKAVRNALQTLFPRADIRFCALSMIRFSEPTFATDYYLYKDTIIQTGTSKDSEEYNKFLAKYTEWQVTHESINEISGGVIYNNIFSNKFLTNEVAA